MYYENGYEAIGEMSVKDLSGTAIEIPVMYLDLSSRLYIVGEPASAVRAIEYLRDKLDSCTSSAAEFALHFMCENNFGVKIVKMMSRQLTA